MQHITDDPVRDAERDAAERFKDRKLHRCFMCDLEIEPDEKFYVHHTTTGITPTGAWRFEDIYFCEFCLKGAVLDVQTYKDEGWEV